MGTKPLTLETFTTAGERTGLSVRSLRRYVAEGRLPAYRMGSRTIRLDPADVDNLFTRTDEWKSA